MALQAAAQSLQARRHSVSFWLNMFFPLEFAEDAAN
jgi:hypothetical protein